MFTTKQGDTRTALKATLTTASGEALTDVASIKFRMSDTLYKNKIDRHVDIVALPEVAVIFTPAEVATEGNYYGEFVVEYTDSKVETFPNSGYINIKIEKNLGGA